MSLQDGGGGGQPPMCKRPRENPDKTYKLKSKLLKKFGSCINFWQPNYKSELVYLYGIPHGQAIETPFEVAASENKHIEEAALVLRRIITESHKESVKLPWQPSANNLLSGTVHPPPLLENFLSILLTDKQRKEAPKKKKQLAGSFAQDICTEVTNGQWAMPKHLPSGMRVRNLTGSAELTTILNRFSHCASYSVLLELETAMCSSIEQWQSGIFPQLFLTKIHSLNCVGIILTSLRKHHHLVQVRHTLPMEL